MLKLFSKLLGLVFLALAVITAIVDLTKTIADSKLVMTALGELWASMNVASLQFLQVGIQRKLEIPWAWDLIFIPLLQMPGWLVFGILAMLLLWLGRKTQFRIKKRRYN